MAKKNAETAADVVDKKSDVRGAGDEKFRKEFVVQALRTALEDLTDDEGGFHASNKQQVLEQALYRGLRPKGEVELESTEVVHESAVGTAISVKLVYAVPCIPASIDYDPSSTVTAVDNEDTKREHARLAKLRAQSDPAGFDAA
jgi:hypothetical protein